jgi:DNA invertase Pin-like site-specific DNA recombinase
LRLRTANVVLVAVPENLTILPDKEDLTSDVFIFLLGLAAKLERTAINDRIASARARMADEGKPWGRKPLMTVEQVARAPRVEDRGSDRSRGQHRASVAPSARLPAKMPPAEGP